MDDAIDRMPCEAFDFARGWDYFDDVEELVRRRGMLTAEHLA